MARLLVRPVSGEDAAALDRAIPMGGYFTELHAKCDKGNGVLVAAWSGAEPRGHGYLWDGEAPESPEHLSAVPVVRQWLDGTPLLQNLQVLPDYRRQGIGARLVAAIEAAGRERGHRRLALGVGPDNDAARSLYRRLGYQDWPHGTVEVTYTGIASDGGTAQFTEVVQMMHRTL